MRFINFIFLVCSAVLVLISCRKREAGLPDNLVTFESTAIGIRENENNAAIKLKLSRATDRDIAVTLNLTEQGAVYGTNYTTNPAARAGKIVVTIPSGNNEASVTISKVPGALFDGSEKLVMDIYSSASPVIIGVSKQLTISFAELVASSAALTIDGGGVNFPNKVFIDLSANRQTGVQRTTWDLGFYTGADDYRVILNSSTAMMAKQLNKTDLAQVTAADTVGFSTEVSFSQATPAASQMAYIDHPSGDLTKTAIASISANASENKIYIINRGTGVGVPAPARGWKKVRIVRNASGGYTLQHADIASTTFQEINIAKSESHFFSYVSFENGSVGVEPEKKKWDLAWTYFSNTTVFGGAEVPYLFQDIMIQNRNVQVAKVMNAAKSFDAFAEADIAAQTFSSSQVAIGADWRSGGGPGSGPAVRSDRYYIVKDGDDNYYKVRFTALTKNGERGYPAYEAVLVKRGG